MTPTNPERSDRTRRAILDAARPVFARNGYLAASLNKIIEDSGMTKGAFYFHFRSKQVLAMAVLDDQQHDLMARVVADIADLPTAVERLFATPRVLVAETACGHGPAELARMIGELARDPAIRDEVCGSVQRWLDLVADQFREAQAEESIRSDLDPRMLAEVAVGGSMGMDQLTAQLADDGLVRRTEALIEVVQLATRTSTTGRTRPSTTRRGRTKT